MKELKSNTDLSNNKPDYGGILRGEIRPVGLLIRTEGLHWGRAAAYHSS